jgi:translocation and assembly module TamB
VSLGIELRDVDIRASDSPEGGLAIEGGVSSGGGRLTIEGVSPAVPTRESPARLTIRGRDFQAARTEQVSLPDLEVLAGGQAVDVRGEVDVPRARIDLLEVPQAAVSPSRDVVYVGQPDEAGSEPIEVTAEVNLTLGEDVVFRGLGFSTQLDGSILAIERPGGVTQGRGELVFREGIYRGYGQSLTVEPGRLIFAGPIDDPGVDVRAYRRATDGTRAGFLIGGTLKSLQVNVWSDPAKTDSDAFSYILFGRPLSQGTEADQVQAGNAAAVLGGNMLAMSMASKIGLDDARIETGARQQETAFYAGKYLSPRVYVAYGVGLYEPINVLRVRYLLSRKFTLQAETGTRDSGDILYRIEF